jgi:hypothetical protein
VRLACVAALLAVAMVAASCGSASERPRSAAPATLRVAQKLVPGSLYFEGSYSYVRVERDGHEIAKVKLEDSRGELRLDAGSYRLISFQRPCDGNCGYLDPPMDLCDLPVEVAANQVVTATVRLSPGKGCTIALADGGA